MEEGKRSGRSIARRLVLMVLAWVVAVAVAITLLAALFLSSKIRGDMRREIDLLAKEDSPSLSHALWNYDREAVGLILRGIIDSGLISRIRLRDEGGAILAELEEEGGPASGEGELRFPLSFKPANLEPMEVGTLSLWPSRKTERRDLLQLAAFSACLVSATVVALFFVLRLSVEFLLGRPLRRMVGRLAAVDSVEAGHPIIPPEDYYHEELETISKAVNAMGDRICESAGQFRVLFENSPVSLWDEDFGEVKALVDAARASGVEDWDAYFASDDLVTETMSRIEVRNVNRATSRLIGQSDRDAEGLRLVDLIPSR